MLKIGSGTRLWETVTEKLKETFYCFGGLVFQYLFYCHDLRLFALKCMWRIWGFSPLSRNIQNAGQIVWMTWTAQCAASSLLRCLNIGHHGSAYCTACTYISDFSSHMSATTQGCRTMSSYLNTLPRVEVTEGRKGGQRAKKNIKPNLLYQRLPAVSMAPRYELDGPEIESRWGEIFRTCPDRPRGPPNLLYSGYRVSFAGVKRPGRGVDHPPHLAPRLKKENGYTSTYSLGLYGLF